MRIAYVYRGVPEMTQAVHIQAMIRELCALGHEVQTCFAIPPSAAGVPSRSLLGGCVRRLRRCLPTSAWNVVRGCGDIVTRRRLRQSIAHARPDVIYERYVFMGGSCVRVAQELGIPHIFEVNETARLTAEPWSERTRARAYAMEDDVLARSNALVAVSGVLRDHLVSLGIPTEKVTVMHNGVHGDDFADVETGRASVRERYGFGDRFVIGYLQSWHGTGGLYREILEQLTMLVEHLLPAAPSAVIALIGGGAAWAQVRDHLMAHSPDRQRVIATGPVAHTEVPRLLGALDAGLIVHHQPFSSPLKLFEYMAAGLPVLAPAQPNMQEVIRDGETGLLFRPGDVQGIADRLLWLLSNPDQATQVGTAARTDVLANHTWRSNAERVVDIAARLGAARQ